jgi:hypothetical protein
MEAARREKETSQRIKNIQLETDDKIKSISFNARIEVQRSRDDILKRIKEM